MNTFNIKEKIYVILCVLFCLSIVVGNLLFQKYIIIDFPLLIKMEISVGTIIYPLTFLLTDLIAEFFGKERSEFTIKIGVLACLFTGLLVLIGNKLPATYWSVLSDSEFNKIFGLYNFAFISSIIANFLAQMIDIRIYLFIKKITKDKFLWLRNNLSTIFSQIVDTITVYGVMYYLKIIPSDRLIEVFISALSFKCLFTISFTPIFYMCVNIINKIINSKKLSNIQTNKNINP
ncbi:MAG: queuosine precursor transporter [Sphingobacteriia bacterium]|nr:queuosine precursor transporter [Sphingobacteriia bacterium]